MSIGERITQKRKEMGLSQEALGEKLCVSRQAIYKWEADATLPEIEKLVALAKLFDVPVGWLLGVEEETEEPRDSGELNETQIKMVEEIVGRYLAAQPQPKKPRRWLKAVAALLVVAVGIHLFTRLDGLDRRYGSLNNAMNEINWSVSSQIDSIAGRVEEILKSQNDLTADYGTELVGADLRADTVRFALRSVPRTFVDGMDAVFLVNSGTGPAEFPAQLSAGGVFSAEVTAALTDNISLSVVFIYPDGTRRTQLLDTYDYLRSSSIPDVQVDMPRLIGDVVEGGRLVLREDYATVRPLGAKTLGDETATVEHVELGIFVNQTIVAWGKECAQPESYQGDWSEHIFFRLPETEVKLGSGDRLQIAALVTDSFGRQFMAQDIPLVTETDRDGTVRLTHPADARFDSDVADWVLVTGEVLHTITPIGRP